ncbi:phenylalanine 4-monooxygenase [Nocardia sp. 2YAB30]
MPTVEYGTWSYSGNKEPSTVMLAQGHPGYSDDNYRRRRNAIAMAATRYRPGDPIPEIDYNPDDDECWRQISDLLAERHNTFACREILQASARLQLPIDHVPQLRAVSQRLNEISGFGYVPAVGIVPVRQFYGSLADDTFNSTQYIRHLSQPLFSPEPDMVHEVIGHGSMLASKRFADMYRLVGRAVRRVTTSAAVEAISRFFWFTMECGLIRENGDPMVCGASLLSSYGELAQFRNATIRPMDPADMVSQDYDDKTYQPVLFCARSLDHFEDVVSKFLQDVDDEYPSKLNASWVI